jgi:hypothetical protein
VDLGEVIGGVGKAFQVKRSAEHQGFLLTHFVDLNYLVIFVKLRLTHNIIRNFNHLH